MLSEPIPEPPLTTTNTTKIPSVSDEALAARLIAGDQRAFETIVLRWRDRIVDFAYLLTNDRHAAEDVGQEVFVRFLRRPDAFDPSRSFGAWIRTVARNLCRDRWRRESARSRHQENAAREFHFGPQPVSPPSAAAQESEGQHELREAIAELPARFREVFVLCSVRGLSYGEAAAICGCPAKTVSTRLARARQRLVTRMEKWL